MRRKLINFEAFDRIQKESLSTAEYELHEVQDILSRALNVDGLSLDCFSENSVIYETVDGTYLHANYSLKNNYLVFENIEELVIDEESNKENIRNKIREMMELVISNDQADNLKANEIFSDLISAPYIRKKFNEGVAEGSVRDRAAAKKAGRSKTKNTVSDRGRLNRQKRELNSFGPNPNKRKRVGRGDLNLGGTDNKSYQKQYYKTQVKGKHRPRKVLTKNGVKIKRAMKEWTNLTNNVFNYLEYQNYGPILKESVAHKDEKGNVVSLRVPCTKLRNEGKILSFNWKVLNTDLKVIRESALELAENAKFRAAICEVKKNNNISDNDSLEESIENVITYWPSVIYLTQDELASIVSECLSMEKASNYDDQICNFIAEGILRTAHHVMTDKVEKIMKIAGTVTTESEDKYLDFQNAVNSFYPSLDEKFSLETKVFEDLHEAVSDVISLAIENNDLDLKSEAEEILKDLTDVLEGNIDPELSLVEEVAEWLSDIIETNLTPEDWTVSNTTHITTNGDHPEMVKKAKKSYSPAEDLASDADWQKTTTEPAFEGPKWTSVGGDDVWPNLTNPYIPKPFGDYTMKGETGVDKDVFGQHHASWQSNDTWPNLKNPYLPQAVTPQSYKMNNGPETDLVVDR